MTTTRPPPTFHRTATVADVIAWLRQPGRGTALVVHEGQRGYNALCDALRADGIDLQRNTCTVAGRSLRLHSATGSPRAVAGLRLDAAFLLCVVGPRLTDAIAQRVRP